MENCRVKDISQQDERTLRVAWTDGKTDLFDVVMLRKRCPCASCIDEWTHEPRLDAKSIPDSVRPVRVDSVGRYAMRFNFSDGHSTGIYTFKMMREMANKS